MVWIPNFCGHGLGIEPQRVEAKKQSRHHAKN